MSVLESLEYNIRSLENLADKKSVLEQTLSSVEKNLKSADAQLDIIQGSRVDYTQAIDIIYRESLGALKETLNTALRYIMYDKHYSVNLVLDDKRGFKTLEILLVDEDEGIEIGLKDGVGQGVRTIISCVLKVYYLLNQGSNVLLLDEKYSALSSSYVQLFFEFLEQLCKEKGIILVLITHDERFMNYSSKSFMINDGMLIQKEEEKTEE